MGKNESEFLSNLRRMQMRFGELKKWQRYSIIAVVSFLILIMFAGCNAEVSDHVGEARTPSGSGIQKGKLYEEVVSEFEEAGFTNVKLEIIDDLITGWLTKDGEVEYVSVDGDEGYSPDEWYDAGVEVIIAYHTFPDEEKEEVVTGDTTENEAEESSTDADEETVAEEIITVENNEEFALLLSKGVTNDDMIAFAEKYKGRLIKFDGNIAYMDYYENYKTRFSLLVYAWDYSEITASGPNFKIDDVNMTNDMHFSGEGIPEYISVGQHFTFTAEVLEFNVNNELFFIDPVLTEAR